MEAGDFTKLNRTKNVADACKEFRLALIEENANPNLKKAAKRPEDEPLRTDGIVVLHQGKRVFEYYDGLYGPETPHCLWSASKSVSAALLGVAIRDGKISLDDHLSDFLSPPKGAPSETNSMYKQVLIRDLLAMQSGFQWNESYDGDLRTSSITGMLYLNGYRDMAAFALLAPLLASGPGNQWNYNSGNVSLIQAALKKVYGIHYDEFPWTSFFEPMGMKTAVLERDGAGTFIGSSYASLTPRDMAKFGNLYLNDGLWEGQPNDWKLNRVLPEAYVRMAAKEVAPSVNSPATTKEYILSEGVYSAGGFWLNQALPAKGLEKPFPDAPADLYFAGGHYGQIILIMPSHHLIVARTGHDTEYWSKINRIARSAVGCFSSNEGGGE